MLRFKIVINTKNFYSSFKIHQHFFIANKFVTIAYKNNPSKYITNMEQIKYFQFYMHITFDYWRRNDILINRERGA